MTSSEVKYHQPVLLHESVEGLNLQPSGQYVDATFGGGGHTRAILQQLGPEGKLVAFDRDDDALANLPDDDRLYFAHHDYKWIKHFLHYYRVVPVDGILADLGVSSHQLNTDERGFSFRREAKLDMRMDQQIAQSAEDVVNTYSAEALQRVFGQYGEIRNAKELTDKLVKARSSQTITGTLQLAELADECRHRNDKPSKYLSQVFQALRIEVNQELQSLMTFLTEACDVLTVGGRFSVITYHSLEDRLVKQFFQHGNFKGKTETDLFGNVLRPLKPVNRKPILPSAEEITQNPRARSAKLRIAEKLEPPSAQTDKR